MRNYKRHQRRIVRVIAAVTDDLAKKADKQFFDGKTSDVIFRYTRWRISRAIMKLADFFDDEPEQMTHDPHDFDLEV